MARVEIDPNYSSPTFPRATAAADIFKKEDVQALAAAMSTHTHDGAGKGLVLTTLPAGAIAAGTITSAMIADGTIDTADLKDGSVTSAKIFDGTITAADIAANALTDMAEKGGTASSPSTTSAAVVDMPDMTITYTTAVTTNIRVDFHGIFLPSAAAADTTIVMVMDGTLMSAALASVTSRSAGANLYTPLTLHALVIAQPAGTHTVKMQWAISSGTLTSFATYRYMSMEQLRR